MSANLRQFEVTDPFDRTWQVEFRWQQNAISIRHCDAVDCKYYLTSGDERRELVVALMHGELVAAASGQNREVTDPWCMGLAAAHVQHMISTWEDMDKGIATVAPAALVQYAAAMEGSAQRERDRASYTH